MTTRYPEELRQRDQWILARRGARNRLDPFKPHACFVEKERAESGEIISVATIFLTNRECPWRCLMCDLWKSTLTRTVPVGAIPAQIDYALGRLEEPASTRSKSNRSQVGDDMEIVSLIKQIKLYNSGSFFDPRAIPPEDHEAIARRVAGFERVIVECHPALVGESVLTFRDLLDAIADANPPSHEHRGRAGRPQPAEARRGGDIATYHSIPAHGFDARPKLEVAMGLETAHPEVLKRLNKRMTLEQFRRAADFLRKNGIALRVFVLVKPPFLDEAEALHWARRSIDFAFDCAATAVSLIPTRPGNGALEALAGQGEFSPPKLAMLEAALDYGVSLKRGRVFADLWDLEKFSECGECFEQRRARLQEMNLSQTVLPQVQCKRGCDRHGGTRIRSDRGND